MKNKIYLMRGIQGSGKSTRAKELLASLPNSVRVNNDELRLMIFNRVFDPKDTKYIDDSREILIKRFLEKKMSVIIDNMNLDPKYEARYREYAKEYDTDFQIEDFTNVPLDVCIERDKKRQNPIGKNIIRNTYLKYIKKTPPKVEFIEGLDQALIVDIDGTAALLFNRSPYEEEKCIDDIPNNPVIQTIVNFVVAGFKIILCSGRDEGRGRKSTEEWLKKHNIPYDHLFMRKAGDTRKDSIVKKEIYDTEIKGKFNILFCMDDRDQVVDMLRNEIGLPVFQVNYGNF